MPEHRLPERDRPWVMRTYAGHSDARRSNELYRRNLAKGQTGLSVAFDLPTQTGYDPDHVLARGEVGKVGVSIVHKGDMHALLDGIPLDEMNTSMTINATAAWLLGLYVTVAEENGVDRSQLKGTTQNDIIKEYLSRGTYAFPPEPSMRLIADMVAFTVNEVPNWNPTNICSYHLQEAGATPVQEIAYALSTGIAVLDEVQARGQVAEEDFPKVFGRISFFVNAGIRLIEEIAKLRAMGRLWNEIGRERYGVTDEKMLRFRYGVQVNSLGLTEAQPENNVQRIVLEALAVTLSPRRPRPRDPAPGLERGDGPAPPLGPAVEPADPAGAGQRDRPARVPRHLRGLEGDGRAGRGADRGRPRRDGGRRGARRRGRGRPLHEGAPGRVPPRAGGADRARRAEGGRPEQLHRDRGLAADRRRRRRHPHPRPRGRARADRGARALEGGARRERGARRRSTSWRRVARAEDENIMPATIAAAKAGATTGEWAGRLREVFGDYRAPTGVDGAAPAADREQLAEIRERVDEVSDAIGHRIKILVGKPGLDGHSNGSEQVALRARDVGMEVVYQGIRLTPEEIAESALQEDVDVVGLSILSGSHLELIPEVVRLLRDEGVDVPVVVGGIIPAADAERLREAGVAGVYTPKDFDINRIMGEIVELVGQRANSAAHA